MDKDREERTRDFHRAFGVAIGSEPTAELLKLRRRLMDEETKELFADMDSAIALLENGKEVPKELYANMLKEMSDIQIALSGTAVSLKPLKEFETAFRRVIESNMSKLDANGKPIHREDGKVLKGPGYKAPDLLDLV